MKNDIAKLNSLIKRVLAYGPSRKVIDKKQKKAELAEALATDVLKGRKRAKKRIQKARQEIEDGALPQKGRFRL
jgi:uncharacterized protein YhfF